MTLNSKQSNTYLVDHLYDQNTATKQPRISFTQKKLVIMLIVTDFSLPIVHCVTCKGPTQFESHLVGGAGEGNILAALPLHFL